MKALALFLVLLCGCSVAEAEQEFVLTNPKQVEWSLHASPPRPENRCPPRLDYPLKNTALCADITSSGFEVWPCDSRRRALLGGVPLVEYKQHDCPEVTP